MKAIWLERDRLIEKLKVVSSEAGAAFPEIMEIRLFGSLARGEETGLSDVDLFALVESAEKNPLERVRPYFNFFSERLGLSLDMLSATPAEAGAFEEVLAGSLVLYKKSRE